MKCSPISVLPAPDGPATSVELPGAVAVGEHRVQRRDAGRHAAVAELVVGLAAGVGEPREDGDAVRGEPVRVPA